MASDAGHWQPVLSGEAGEQARAAVAAIAASLANSLPAEDDPTGAPLARHAALESGRAGLALFYAYLARSTGDRAALDQAEALLARALDDAPRAEVGPSLCAGIT